MRDLQVNDREAFLNYCWEVGWLDERFGDDPAVDPDPDELLANLVDSGFVEAHENHAVDEQHSRVPGVRATRREG